MRKASKLFSANLWVNLLLALWMGSLASCSDKEDTLLGHWYCLNGSHICCMSFSEDGTGEITDYTYSERQWSERKFPLQYTLSGNTLILKPAEGDVFRGEVGVAGNSMSLANEDSTTMFTRYNGDRSTIDALKKEIENNQLDVLPQDTIDGESFWQGEEQVTTAITALYIGLRDYEYKQMLLEKIRLTGKDFYDRPAKPITPNSNEVSQAWEAAYKTISRANMVINALESNKPIEIDEHKRVAYANEAKVLRSLVYYNVAQLWEKVPFITVHNPDDPYASQSPVLPSRDIYLELNNTLSGIAVLPEGEHKVTLETVKALQGEISLSLGDKEGAKDLLAGCHPDFNILIDKQQTPEMYQIFGDKIPNYTSDKIELLLQEADMRNDEDAFLLIDNWSNKKQYWGYWVMLKRTRQAQTVCGCKEHELLMPIPQVVLELGTVSSLEQNPGYRNSLI